MHASMMGFFSPTIHVTRAAGGAVAIVTKGPTPYDADAEVRLDGDVVEELETLLRLL